MKWFHARIHESLAYASVLALSISLHVAWMSFILVYRNPVMADVLTFVQEIGPISGQYMLTLSSFFLSWILIFFLARGRDLSHFRDRLFWFFVISLVLFLLMTCPIVYQIGVVIE